MLLRSATAVPLDSPAPSRERLQTAARELEAQFAQLMLKSMRSASFGDPLLGDNTMYRDMYDRQLSQELTKGRGLGLAPMIVRQLERTLPAPPSTPATTPTPTPTLSTGGPLPLAQNLPLPLATPTGTLALTPSHAGVSMTAVAPPPLPAPPPAARAEEVCDPNARLDCSSPEAFVRSIWPHAKATARELGVSAKALVAQAALETGWGRRLVGAGEGATSHNLFGIKAGGRWSGASVSSATHEFVGGRRQSQRADFRAYGSLHESFADYARLMRGERYTGALAAGDDCQRYAQALQRAGYATDPAYAAKITAIAEGPTLQRALSALDDTAGPALAALPAHPRG